MERRDLENNMHCLGLGGVIFTDEQKATLPNRLLELEDQSKHKTVYFLGRVKCTGANDYYLAMGVDKDEIADRKFYYSTSTCKPWALLNPATTEMREKCKLVKGRFVGDPSFETEHTEIKKTLSDDGDELEEEIQTVVKEEERLASFVAEFMEDVFIVPRGAMTKIPTGLTTKNRSFEGLSTSESAKLCNYFHLREPVNFQKKTLLQKANCDKAIDFLDSVEEDCPKGSWALQFEKGSAQLTMRNLLWPGYHFCHLPGTRSFCSVYCGDGSKNHDLAFML